MLGPDTTWGDVRKIYAKSLNAPERWFEDNVLSDPEVRQMSIGKPDNEIIGKPGQFVGPEPEEDPESDDPEDGLGDDVEFSLIFDNDDEAVLLLRNDFEEGAMYYRSSGAWVKITPDDEMPLLDEYPQTRVTGEAVDMWDGSEERSKDFFSEALLDDAE